MACAAPEKTGTYLLALAQAANELPEQCFCFLSNNSLYTNMFGDVASGRSMGKGQSRRFGGPTEEIALRDDHQ